MNGTDGIVWDLGFIIGVSIAAIIAVILILLIAAGIWVRDGGAVGIFSLLLIVAIAVTGWLTWPWEAAYHQWRPVSGQVEQISSRMISAGKGMSQRFVVVIGGQPYAIDDTRASLLKVGDRVSLMCTKEWQWASVPGDACRWVA